MYAKKSERVKQDVHERHEKHEKNQKFIAQKSLFHSKIAGNFCYDAASIRLSISCFSCLSWTIVFVKFKRAK